MSAVLHPARSGHFLSLIRSFIRHYSKDVELSSVDRSTKSPIPILARYKTRHRASQRPIRDQHPSGFVGPIRRHPKSSRCVGPPRFHRGASAAIRHQMGPSGPIPRTPSTRVKSIMIARPFLSGSALRSASGAAAKTRSRSSSSVAIRAHP